MSKTGESKSDEPRSPVAELEALAVQEVDVTPDLRHVEIFTLRGLLTLLWHGPDDATDVVLMCGGAAGGLLGPADGLYHDLGVQFAGAGTAVVRVSYRQPNDLDLCVADVLAAADLAGRNGGRRFMTVGHSFGGAVAVRAAIMLGDHAAGVVTLATQSAGCEVADQLAGTPLLLLHGDRDELLPAQASEIVSMLGGGTLEILPGTGHLMVEANDILRERLGEWIPARLEDLARRQRGSDEPLDEGE